MKKQGELRKYECSLNGNDWWSCNATSYGKAKAEFYRMLDMEIKYTWIKCRCTGLPYTSEDFIRNAKYRGIDFAYCGMVVAVDGAKGIITGHNSSANLDILFTDGKYKGQTLNCHPNYKMTYFDSKGEIIKSFNDVRDAS